MKTLNALLICSLLCTSSFSALPVAYAEDDLDEDTIEQLENAGKKMKELLEKYQKAEVEKYNEITVTAKDTDGNPRDCTVKVYYNDFMQERLSTSGGSFTGVFNHGKLIPTKILSVAVYDCPCSIIKMDVSGPTYPVLIEEIEKIKLVIEDEVGETVTDKASEWAKGQAEKAMERVFESMGHSSVWAKRFMTAVGIGADLGQPFKQYFDQQIQKIFDANRMQDERRHELLDEHEPKRPTMNVIKEGWSDWLWSGATGSSWHSPFTKYTLDLLLICPDGYEPNSHWPDYARVDRTPPITPPPEDPDPPTTSGGGHQSEGGNATPSWPDAPLPPESTQLPKPEPTPPVPEPEPEPDCTICDPILELIETKKAELEAKEAEQDAAFDAVTNLMATRDAKRAELKNAQKALTRARNTLYDFNNASSYVESEGRRIDTTDLEIQRQASRAGWERYKNGEISAQELESYWEGLDAAEIAELRQKAKEQLEKDVADAEKNANDCNTEIADLDAKIAEQQKKIADCGNKKNEILAEIAKLKAQYEDCVKRCKNREDVNVVEDYNLPVPKEEGFLCGWFGWFCGEENGERRTENEEVNEEEVEVEEEVESEDKNASDESEDAEEDKVEDAVDTDDSTASEKPTCSEPYMSGDVCEAECDGACNDANIGVDDCYVCEPRQKAPLDCSEVSGFHDRYFHSPDECSKHCNMTCVSQSFSETDSTLGGKCWFCEQYVCDEESNFTKKSTCEQHCGGECEPHKTFFNPAGGCWQCKEIVRELQCDDGTYSLNDCINTCGSELLCEVKYTRADNVACWGCTEEIEIEEIECSDNTRDLAQCEAECEDRDDGTCVVSYTREDGKKCYACDFPDEPEEEQPPRCPSGTVDDQQICNDQCSEGSCQDVGDGCFQCVVVQCPAGSTKNDCPASCTNGCTVVAEQGNTQCLVCSQTCEDICQENGFPRVGIDWSDHIQQIINQHSCVSGASVSLTRATIGDCTCSQEPSVSIDTTVPVCTGTSCGDVQCGQTVSCPVDENTTATVSCNWGGWKKIDVNQFQPVVGE